MRMWLVNPIKMCRNHLLGEHVELHMLTGCLKKKMRITGFVRKGQVFPALVKKRHSELVKEMLSRSYNHNTPIEIERNTYRKYTIPADLDDIILINELEIASRCSACKLLQSRTGGNKNENKQH